jgi:hypothetical protein
VCISANTHANDAIDVHLRFTPSFIGVVLAGLWSGMSLYNPPLDALINPFFIRETRDAEKKRNPEKKTVWY